MAENQIEINGVEEVKTQTAIRKILEKGEVIERRLVTKVTFEGEIDPHEVARIHRLLKTGATVNVAIWSPQLEMKLAEEER